MENVKVKKQEVLETIKKNREQHRKIFLEAVDGYKAKCVELLEMKLKAIKNGWVGAVSVSLPVPEDHTKDYDRAIKMLEMSVDDVIEMDEDSFTQFVMDDWHWKRNFLVSNSAYSGTATAMLAQSDFGS